MRKPFHIFSVHSFFSSHGQRGVLFTFLTFLFISVVVGLLVFNINLSNRTSTSTVEISALNAINSKYDDITDDIITLDHPIGIPSIHQRFLPFSHEIDKNTISFIQPLPISSGKLSLYFDLINAYSIFVQDQNAQRTFDGVHVTFDVPKPPLWGGSNQTASFNILPQCVQYQIIDTNTIDFSSTNTIGCENNFSMLTQVSRIDINVYLPSSVDDYNRVTCSFNGVSSCPHEDYNAANGPHISILFFDSNCASCSLSSSDKNISGHFDPSLVNSITYDCTNGTSCASQPLTFTFSAGLKTSHGGTGVVLSSRISFTENIQTFYYQDANYTVGKTGFDTTKSNVVVFPQ